MATNIKKTDDQWREELTPEQYEVLRKGGTERAFTGKYWDKHDDGVYRCAGCGAELFRSEAKFDSGSGWPSFVEPASLESVGFHAELWGDFGKQFVQDGRGSMARRNRDASDGGAAGK